MNIKFTLSQAEAELTIDTLRRYIAILGTVADQSSDAKPIKYLRRKLEKIFNDSFGIEVGSYVKYDGEKWYVYDKDESGGLGVENRHGISWVGVAPKYVTKIRKR